jgi:hypothetical protein
MADRIFINDSAVLEASVYADPGEPVVSVVDTLWYVVTPNGTNLLVDTTPLAPVAGQKVINRAALTPNPVTGSGTLPQWTLIQYDGAAWSTIVPAPAFASYIDGNDATGVVHASAIDQTGLWRTRCRFTLDDGTTRSSLVNFEVVDPLAPLVPADSNSLDWVVDHAYMKLEDLFDSELGGPWLADKTMKNFSRDKMARLVPDALYYVNNEGQPVTSFNETTFPLQAHKALLAQALLVETIYHLMRSYVEQPQPTGQAITYFDRRDYLTRWGTVLGLEEAKLIKQLDIFKLQYMGFGSSALLVGGYASSLFRTPAAYRTRYPKYVMPYRSL